LVARVAAIPAPIFEVAHQLLFLGVNRDHRLTALLIIHDLPIDIRELGVAIRVITAFSRLAIGLQAVTEFAQ